jgi:hypothetical protein
LNASWCAAEQRIRITQVRAAWVEGRSTVVPSRLRLSRLLARHPERHLDLDVEFARGDRLVGFRVVVIPGRDRTLMRVCTNLPCTPLSSDLVARLYRQVITYECRPDDREELTWRKRTTSWRVCFLRGCAREGRALLPTPTMPSRSAPVPCTTRSQPAA